MNSADIERYKEKVPALIGRMNVSEKISQLTNSAAVISRLGVNKYDWLNEALHGVARAGTATVFPQFKKINSLKQVSWVPVFSVT